jgi:hypothetical protein
MTGGSGTLGYISSSAGVTGTGSPVLGPTTNAGTATSQLVGAFEGVAGQITFAGVISDAKFTTAGGQPLIGAYVYLAASTDDGNTGAGKLTASLPAAGAVVQRAGICIDNATYAATKTCKIFLYDNATPNTYAAVKPSDQPNATTGLTNETALAVPVGPFDTWVITWTLFCTFGTGAFGGFQFAIVTPAGSYTVIWTVTAITNSAVALANQISGSGTTASASPLASPAVITITATIVGDTNITHGGNVTLQFAESTSSATATVLKAGSSVSAVRR